MDQSRSEARMPTQSNTLHDSNGRSRKRDEKRTDWRDNNREKKICSLEYADNVVLVATSEGELREMIRRLERYLEEKKLSLNEKKSKVMVFRKGGGRRKKTSWIWKEKPLEEVNEFKYLGYLFKCNRKNKEHINKRMKKAVIVMKHV